MRQIQAQGFLYWQPPDLGVFLSQDDRPLPNPPCHHIDVVFPLAVEMRLRLVEHTKLAKLERRDVDFFLQLSYERACWILTGQTMTPNDIPNVGIELAVWGSFAQQYPTLLEKDPTCTALHQGFPTLASTWASNASLVSMVSTCPSLSASILYPAF